MLHVTDTLCYHQVSFMWGGEEKHTATLLNRDTGWEQFQLAFELFYEVMTYSFERFKWKLEHDPIKCLQKLLAYAKRWRDTSRNDIRVKTSVRKSHGTGCESSLESDPPPWLKLRIQWRHLTNSRVTPLQVYRIQITATHSKAHCRKKQGWCVSGLFKNFPCCPHPSGGRAVAVGPV